MSWSNVWLGDVKFGANLKKIHSRCLFIKRYPVTPINVPCHSVFLSVVLKACFNSLNSTQMAVILKKIFWNTISDYQQDNYNLNALKPIPDNLLKDKTVYNFMSSGNESLLSMLTLNCVTKCGITRSQRVNLQTMRSVSQLRKSFSKSIRMMMTSREPSFRMYVLQCGESTRHASIRWPNSAFTGEITCVITHRAPL